MQLLYSRDLHGAQATPWAGVVKSVHSRHCRSRQSAWRRAWAQIQGWYIGGSIGQSEIDASGNTFLTGPISESETNTDLSARNIGEGDVDVMSIGLIYRFR